MHLKPSEVEVVSQKSAALVKLDPHCPMLIVLIVYTLQVKDVSDDDKCYEISTKMTFTYYVQAVIIRRGLSEMISLAQALFPSVQSSTFMESCGMADLVASCYGGRNRKVAEAYAKLVVSGKPRSFEDLEVCGHFSFSLPQFCLELDHRLLISSVWKQICIQPVAFKQYKDQYVVREPCTWMWSKECTGFSAREEIVGTQAVVSDLMFKRYCTHQICVICSAG